MAKNKWFDTVFLPSLFSRFGTNNSHWLTAKQAAICIDNMQENTCVENNGYNTIKHKYFTCTWEGREVVLQYSSKNGCGTISFSSTAAEAEKAYIANQADKKAREIERLTAQKANHPEHFFPKIEKARQKVENIKDIIKIYQEDGEEVDPLDIETLEKAENELSFLLSI